MVTLVPAGSPIPVGVAMTIIGSDIEMAVTVPRPAIFPAGSP